MDISIHNLLFNPSKIMNTHEQLILEMQPYMLTVNNRKTEKKEIINEINTITNDVVCAQESLSKPVVNREIVTNNSVIMPTQKDTLFWCIYIVLHEYADYINIHHNYSIKEMEWKQTLLKDIMANPTYIKNSNRKITKAGVQEILSELMTDVQNTSAACLVAICVYRNINIIVLEHTKKIRIEFMSSDVTNNTYVLYKTDNNKYSICTEALGEPEIIDIRNTSFLIEKNEKPLKSVGSYKTDALIDIAKLLCIYDHNEIYKKAELYALISDKVKPITL
jgi:hypothetical protein